MGWEDSSQGAQQLRQSINLKARELSRGGVGVVMVKAAASLRRCPPSVTSEAAAVALVTSPDLVLWVYVLISRLSPLMRKS